MPKTAKFVKSLPGFRGEANLYELSEPVEYHDNENGNKNTTFVVVSAVMIPGLRGFTETYPETYIFPADENGQIINWMELPGSFRGALNHTQALNNAGYEVTQ